MVKKGKPLSCFQYNVACFRISALHSYNALPFVGSSCLITDVMHCPTIDSLVLQQTKQEILSNAQFSLLDLNGADPIILSVELHVCSAGYNPV